VSISDKVELGPAFGRRSDEVRGAIGVSDLIREVLVDSNTVLSMFFQYHLLESLLLAINFQADYNSIEDSSADHLMAAPFTWREIQNSRHAPCS